MTKLKLILFLGFGILTSEALCQRKDKLPRYMGNPIITDSLSTIFFPVLYNDELLSANKIALLDDYYANIIVYNIKADTYRKLFSTDTYIEGFKYQPDLIYKSNTFVNPKSVTVKWVFLLVKNKDSNGNGRIDSNDPSILFVTDTKGGNLKVLTSENENIVALNIFDNHEFALVKIQRDLNKDGSFKNEDKDFYFRKIDLKDLTVGKGIEIE